MKICYQSATDTKLFNTQKKLEKKFGKERAEVIMRRITLIRGLEVMQGLYEVWDKPMLHFHPLRENYSGMYALRIDARCRMILEPYPEKPGESVADLKTIRTVILVEVVDYHE